jgi:exopolysaccharide production protein ExoQ
MSQIATLVMVLGILGLFVLDRDRGKKTSKALWLPVAWLSIAGSRPLSAWLQVTSSSSPEQYLDGSPLDRNLYVVLLFAGVIVLVGRRTAVLKLLQANWLLLLFVSYCAVSILWSDYPDVAFKRWIKSLGDYVMVFIVLTDRDRSRAVKQVLARVGFVLLPLSVLLIKYYPELGRSYARFEGTQYFMGVAQDKNMLGMACLVFGIAAAWRFFQEFHSAHKSKMLIVHGAIFAMALWLLIKSDSMTSLSCFLLAVAMMAANTFLRAARKPKVVHLMVAVVLLACFSPLFLDLGSGVLEALGRDPTLTGRTEIWEHVLNVPVNPVLGTGFESFWLGKRLETLWAIPGMNQINEAHNGYLEVYLNLGWIGVILIGLIMIAGYRNILRLLSRDAEEGRLRLAYFVVAVAYNFTEAAIRTADLVWIAFLLSMIVLPKISVARSRSEKARISRMVLLEAEEVA